MIKRFFYSAIISLFFAVHANAWDMNGYVENAQAGVDKSDSTIWKKSENHRYDVDRSMAQTSIPKDTLKHHSISFTYGIITMTDIAAAYASVATSIFSLGSAELQENILGAFSIDYGYKFNEVVETGIVFNYAHPIEKFIALTFMPKLKLNFNNNGFLNPFLELDAGICYFAKVAVPMFHVTFFGLEIGRNFPIILHLLSFGQRGVVSAGIGVRI